MSANKTPRACRNCFRYVPLDEHSRCAKCNLEMIKMQVDEAREMSDETLLEVFRVNRDDEVLRAEIERRANLDAALVEATAKAKAKLAKPE